VSCHYNSAQLRLYSPLLAEAHLIGDDASSLTSLVQSGISPLEIFTAFTSALRTWLQDWLRLPVCSYFYLPQPVLSQLIHAAMNLIQWARIAGPSATRFSCISFNANANLSRKTKTSLSSFLGISPCPELVAEPCRPLGANPDVDSRMAAREALSALRAEIFLRPELPLDILALADQIITRFEAARKEMAAARGGEWQNDMWDVAAEHMRTKQEKVVKWCQSAAVEKADDDWPLLPGHGTMDVVPVGWGNGAVEGQEDWVWTSDGTMIGEGVGFDFGGWLNSGVGGWA
jgi:hypothetical protein